MVTLVWQVFHSGIRDEIRCRARDRSRYPSSVSSSTKFGLKPGQTVTRIVMEVMERLEEKNCWRSRGAEVAVKIPLSF